MPGYKRIEQYGIIGEETSSSSRNSLQESLEDTVSFWRNWAHQCEGPEKCVFTAGPWHDLMVRSGLVLKLLTHSETGGITAAPTTSLPEWIGGERNWDYRYGWVRDSSFTVQALYNLGHVEEARSYMNWLMDICTETFDPRDLRIMYGLHGDQSLKERELDHLSGYMNSRPVRIGNAASEQLQLDIYGEMVNGIYETTRYGESIDDSTWQFARKIADHVCRVWNTPDSGIWEIRGQPRHFISSKLMCWVALDRAIRIATEGENKKPENNWKRERENVRQAILERGYNQSIGSFVQSYGSDILDATSLLIPVMGLLPFRDHRVQSTIDATMKELTSPRGLVYRYLGEDGLSGREGVFILCTFWLVDSLTLSGRLEEAEKLFGKVLESASPLGLLAEEIEPETGAHLGNYPQAFSHIGLINSALYLGNARGGKQKGPEPVGKEEE